MLDVVYRKILLSHEREIHLNQELWILLLYFKGKQTDTSQIENWAV